jgi:flavin-dependent thymidylate synthase
MKLIKQSYKILNPVDTLTDIELAARTCYQSYDKISEDNSSAIKLVNNLLERKHYAMLEFGENIILNVDKEILYTLLNYAHKSFYKGFNITISNTRCLLSFNPRTAIEFLEYIEYVGLYDYYTKDNSIRKLCQSIKNNLPTLLISKFTWILEDGWYPVLGQKLLVSKLEKHVHETLTVRFTTSRSIANELIRHRLCSFSQKSTRYCDEKGDIEFIEPCWERKREEGNFNLALRHAESQYKWLRELDWKPEQAREVLPLSLATEIVIKASLQEWKHIFSLRCDKAAHIQMRELILPLQEEFNKLYPELV